MIDNANATKANAKMQRVQNIQIHANKQTEHLPNKPTTISVMNKQV